MSKNDNIKRYTAKKLTAETITPGDVVLVETDGEAAGQLPVSYEIVPKAIWMIVLKEFQKYEPNVNDDADQDQDQPESTEGEGASS